MKGNYPVIDGKGKEAERTLAAFCRANGQILLPLVELVEQARLALDTVVEHVSQHAIETILQLSAEQIAGPRTPGRRSGEIRWYGNQAGRVSLADRQLSVRKPRLRRRAKGRGGEVGVPLYQALQKNPWASIHGEGSAGQARSSIRGKRHNYNREVAHRVQHEAAALCTRLQVPTTFTVNLCEVDSLMEHLGQFLRKEHALEDIHSRRFHRRHLCTYPTSYLHLQFRCCA